MSATALSLPSISAQQALACQRLGAGVQLPYQVGQEAGLLTLSLGHGPSSAGSALLGCAHGALRMGDPGAVLSLLGDCPVVWPAEPGPDDAWFWAVFHQVLSEPVRAAFGHFEPLPANDFSGIACRLEVRLGASCVSSQLHLPAQTLLGLLDAAPWQRRSSHWIENFALQIPLRLGHLTLAAAELAMLRPGDVVTAQTPLFDASGQGLLRLGHHCLQVQVHGHAASLHLTVLALEENTMNNDADIDLLTPDWSDAQHPSDDAHDAAPFDPAVLQTTSQEAEQAGAEPTVASEPAQRFDDLPLALTLRCGHLELTLGQLRNLAPGVVLAVQGVAAGSAVLFHGERAVAQGELVQIDGRLGLQIVSLDVAG